MEIPGPKHDGHLLKNPGRTCGIPRQVIQHIFGENPRPFLVLLFK